jgi:hypothetical protein
MTFSLNIVIIKSVDFFPFFPEECDNFDPFSVKHSGFF